MCCVRLYSVVILNIIFITSIYPVKSDGNSVLGCGGFIKSHIPIDFSKIEVKLLTRQGILKDRTSCAPNNGYYFVPIYDKGEYILQLEPPAGWSFVPTKIHVVVDGTTDVCSQGKDINFVFKGFGITGKVESFGRDEGPSKITVELHSQTEKRTTETSEGGSFFFTPVYPGTYQVTISHEKWKISSESVDVTVAEGNTELPPKSLVIQGYDVLGMIKSDGAPVRSAKILLFSQESKTNIPVDGCRKDLKSPFHRNILCYVGSDENGVYKFPTVPPGKYFIKPFFENQNIYFEPESIEFEVTHGSVEIATQFKMVGFSVTGRVLKFENGNPVIKARVYLNGMETASTDSNGLYKLEWVKVGTYNIKIEDDDLEFEEVTVKLNPGIIHLPDILPSKYKVCGTVISDNIEIISFDEIETGRNYNVESDPTAGKFCKFLPVGIYTVGVNIDGRNHQKGLQFFPISQSVVVPSEEMTVVPFSQLKATITGEVKCLREKDCMNLKVSIKPESYDDSLEGNEVTVAVTNNKYKFDDISPGNFRIILHSNKLCWRESEHRITVNSAKVSVPQFIQTGFSVIFVSSHSTEVNYNVPGQPNKSLSLKIPKGRSVQCVGESGNYIFQLSSCHTYETNKVQFDTDSGLNEIFLNALQHQVQLAIRSDTNQGDLYVNIHTKEEKKLLGPLTYANYLYKLQLIIAEGETATILPYSDVSYFQPSSLTVTGTNDCQDLGIKFEAKKGKVFEGKIIPPLPGVKITIQCSECDQLVTNSDDKGFYKFLPLDDRKHYKIEAQKDSYIFTGPNENGDFLAHKLAEIIAEVIDEATKTPLEGALLSLSGGESYRSNFKTDKFGKLKFSSLNPGEYFLRPMMKEYSFIPNSKMIDVKEGETVNLVLMGRRVAFSAFGAITSLSGEPEKDVLIVAEGIGNCSQYSEEATSEYSGQFRIRGLQPYCSYDLKVKEKLNEGSHSKRSVPNLIHIDKVTQDVTDLRMIVFRPFPTTEVFVKIISENIEHYKTLKLVVSRESPSYSLVYSTKINTTAVRLTNDVNPGVLLQIPSVTLDDSVYSVQLESSLPSHKWLLQTKYFVANTSFQYVEFDFSIVTEVIEQQIKDTSVWALAFIFSFIFIIYKIDVVMNLAKEKLNLSSRYLAINKKTTSNQYQFDNADIDQIVESINATKRRPKPKKT